MGSVLGGGSKKPDPVAPTPAPVAQDISVKSAEDLQAEAKKRKKGSRASFLTKGQKSKARATSMLGKTNMLGG